MGVRAALLIGVTVCFAHVSHAADCKTIKSQKERLACYDKATTTKTQTADHEETASMFKQRLTENFFDPESARFRNVVGYGSPRASDGEVIFSIMCGEVNGKNRSGGYVGYRRFLVLGGHVEIEERSEFPEVQAAKDQMFSANGKFCKGPILYTQN